MLKKPVLIVGALIAAGGLAGCGAEQFFQARPAYMPAGSKLSLNKINMTFGWAFCLNAGEGIVGLGEKTYSKFTVQLQSCDAETTGPQIFGDVLNEQVDISVKGGRAPIGDPYPRVPCPFRPTPEQLEPYLRVLDEAARTINVPRYTTGLLTFRDQLAKVDFDRLFVGGEYGSPPDAMWLSCRDKTAMWSD